jgi:hypothetical protein
MNLFYKFHHYLLPYLSSNRIYYWDRSRKLIIGFDALRVKGKWEFENEMPRSLYTSTVIKNSIMADYHICGLADNVLANIESGDLTKAQQIVNFFIENAEQLNINGKEHILWYSAFENRQVYLNGLGYSQWLYIAVILDLKCIERIVDTLLHSDYNFITLKGSFQEYPSISSEQNVLNGWLFFLLALQTYCDKNVNYRSEEIRVVLETSRSALGSFLQEYKSSWSPYKFTDGSIASLNYHDFHIALMRALNYKEFEIHLSRWETSRKFLVLRLYYLFRKIFMNLLVYKRIFKAI